MARGYTTPFTIPIWVFTMVRNARPEPRVSHRLALAANLDALARTLGLSPAEVKARYAEVL